MGQGGSGTNGCGTNGTCQMLPPLFQASQPPFVLLGLVPIAEQKAYRHIRGNNSSFASETSHSTFTPCWMQCSSFWHDCIGRQGGADWALTNVVQYVLKWTFTQGMKAYVTMNLEVLIEQGSDPGRVDNSLPLHWLPLPGLPLPCPLPHHTPFQCRNG